MTERTFWVRGRRATSSRVSGPTPPPSSRASSARTSTAVAVGRSAWSFLLQPQGKVDALRAASPASATTTFVLDVDGGFGADVVARLERFKLRIKADIEAARLAGDRGAWRRSDAVTRGRTSSWSGLVAVGARLRPARPRRRRRRLGCRGSTPTRSSAERIEAGWPAMGAEITDQTRSPASSARS